MSRTRKIAVNFFQIAPASNNKIGYDKINASFNSLKAAELIDVHKKLDYILCSHALESKGDIITGALSNGQTGGVLPFRHNMAGDMLPVISPGEKLIHPTCFLYDKKRSILLLENIAKGASVSDWCLYFQNNLKGPAMLGRIVEKGDIDEVIKNLVYITKLDMEVAGFRKNDLFSENSASRSVKEITALAENSKSNTVHCVLKTEVKRVGKDKKRKGQESLDDSFVKRVVDKFRGIQEVKTLNISGIGEDETKLQLINLLEFRLHDSIEVELSELSNANLNLKKRAIRLGELYNKHYGNLARYDGDNES